MKKNNELKKSGKSDLDLFNKTEMLSFYKNLGWPVFCCFI